MTFPTRKTGLHCLGGHTRVLARVPRVQVRPWGGRRSLSSATTTQIHAMSPSFSDTFDTSTSSLDKSLEFSFTKLFLELSFEVMGIVNRIFNDTTFEHQKKYLDSN